MKKEYSKPSMKAYRIKSASIICTSGNVKTNSTLYEDDNNTNVGGMLNGVWNKTNDPD